jgi:hypothetical protein
MPQSNGRPVASMRFFTDACMSGLMGSCTHNTDGQIGQIDAQYGRTDGTDACTHVCMRRWVSAHGHANRRTNITREMSARTDG